ncbi:MAG: hypothetical protein E7673_07485 [Ruminococcaceae bacterium]|nr:hypothetical protein [Oscillospiraceae bacterium]
MYSVDNKRAAVRDIQRFLHVVGETRDIPYLTIDGFYTDETIAAVRAFQRIFSIPITGKVDRDTFDLIYREYITAKEIRKNGATEFNESAFPLKTGDSGNSVAYLNALINEASLFYKDIPLTYGNFYSKNTENAVKLLQRYFRCTETGYVTLNFLNALKKEMTERQNFRMLNITS